MHRRGGKRIRLDDPPPEYENPMTPQVEHEHYGGGYMQYGEPPAYLEQAGTSAASPEGMFESPPTPGMGRRMTRQFGYYDSNGTVINLMERDIYKDDKIGLKTLHEKKKLKIITVPGINHFEWHLNVSIVDNCILPYLN